MRLPSALLSPDWADVLMQIPKSPTGKVLRRELQAKYEKGVAQKKVNSKL